MPEQTTASTPDRVHESFDMNIRPIVIMATVLFAGTGIIMVGLYLSLVVMKNRSAATDKPDNPVQLGQPTPPEPRLQPSPPHETLDSQDLILMRADENRRLNSYSRDAKTGEVHIPIDRAKELLLQQQSQQPAAVGAAK